MSQLLDENDELLASSSREVTLSTGSILSIFFGLALLCALFFGFGYNVGRKSGSAAVLAAVAEPAATTTSSAPASDTFSGFKPPAATPAKTPPTASSVTQQDETGATPASAVPAQGHTAAATATGHQETSSKLPAASGLSTHAAVTPANAPASVESPATGSAGTFFVQVAAVSHPEDASLLMGALRGRGYAVAERTEPADKLIHIQVGPFGSKPTAEAMRQRLQGDGYNAIIK